MKTYVYVSGENGTPVGVLDGRYMSDAYGRCLIASADEHGGLYNNPCPNGGANYFLVGDQVREGCTGGPTVFTIRGNGICDGGGNVTTFHCLNDGEDNKLALALAAIANIGELRFRPSGASVIARSSYSFPLDNAPDKDVDYAKVYGDIPDPWKDKHIQPDIAARFGQTQRSESLYENVQSSRLPPDSNRPLNNVQNDAEIFPTIPTNNTEILPSISPSNDEIFSTKRSKNVELPRFVHTTSTFDKELYPGLALKKKNNSLECLRGMFIFAMCTILPFIVGICTMLYFDTIFAGVMGGVITYAIGSFLAIRN